MVRSHGEAPGTLTHRLVLGEGHRHDVFAVGLAALAQHRDVALAARIFVGRLNTFVQISCHSLIERCFRFRPCHPCFPSVRLE